MNIEYSPIRLLLSILWSTFPTTLWIFPTGYPTFISKLTCYTFDLSPKLIPLWDAPPFLSPTILPNTLPCPLRLLSRKRASVIFASSAPVRSFSLPSQPSLRLGASREPPTQSLGSTLTLSGLSSALLQSSTSVMLLSCGKPFCGLTLHSSSFRLLYNMIVNDYIRSSLLLDTSPIFWSNCPGYHF